MCIDFSRLSFGESRPKNSQQGKIKDQIISLYSYGSIDEARKKPVDSYRYHGFLILLYCSHGTPLTGHPEQSGEMKLKKEKQNKKIATAPNFFEGGSASKKREQSERDLLWITVISAFLQ